MTKILFGILLGLVSVFVYHFHPDVLKPILSATRQIAVESDMSSGIEPQPNDAFKTRKLTPEVPQPVPQSIHKEMDGESNMPEKTAPLEEKLEIAYPLWRFDTKRAAEGFAESIEKGSGVALKIRAESSGYMTYIRAANEQDATARLERIKDSSGITLSRRENNGENENIH